MPESVNAVREVIGDYAVAAIIAGVVSLMTTTVTVRAARKTNVLNAEDTRRLAEMKAGWEAFQEQLDQYVIPAQLRVREHLAKTRDLLGRVLTSFNRLVKLAPQLSPDDMLTEVTNTLDVYAEYRRHITKSETISYPQNLQASLSLAHTQLAKIMLDLHAEPASANGSSNAKLADKLREFEALKNAASKVIEQLLTVSLELPNPLPRALSAGRAADRGVM